MDGVVGKIDCFIIEPFVPHDTEYYLCIQVGRPGGVCCVGGLVGGLAGCLGVCLFAVQRSKCPDSGGDCIGLLLA